MGEISAVGNLLPVLIITQYLSGLYTATFFQRSRSGILGPIYHCARFTYFGGHHVIYSEASILAHYPDDFMTNLLPLGF